MVDRVDWLEFTSQFDWKQGEHVAMIGPTGSGKSTLSLSIMERRKFVCVIGTKPKDATLSKFASEHNYEIVREFPPYFDPVTSSKLVLWPRFKKLGDTERQRRIIGEAMQTMFMQGNWAVNVDELSWLTQELRLEKALRAYWQQGRAIGLSLITGTQRPAFVPLLMYDQSTHLFFWRDNDEANLRRIGGIGALNSAEIRQTVMRLPKHDFLYINSRSGAMLVSRAQV